MLGSRMRVKYFGPSWLNGIIRPSASFDCNPGFPLPSSSMQLRSFTFTSCGLGQSVEVTLFVMDQMHKQLGLLS
jgi:hypothetical protein